MNMQQQQQDHPMVSSNNNNQQMQQPMMQLGNQQSSQQLSYASNGAGQLNNQQQLDDQFMDPTNQQPIDAQFQEATLGQSPSALQQPLVVTTQPGSFMNQSQQMQEQQQVQENPEEPLVEQNAQDYVEKQDRQAVSSKKKGQRKVYEKSRFQQTRHAKQNPLSKRPEPIEPSRVRTKLQKKVEPQQQSPGLFSSDPYFEIKMHENEANQDVIVCDICLEDDDFEGDEIVICDLCHAACHQSCYGGDIKNSLPPPDQPWYCARCQDLIKNKNKKCTDIKCHLCPDLKGILKQVTIEGKDKKQKPIWVHPICVNWIPEIWFTDDNNDRIGGTFNKKRQVLSCGFCHKSQGFCIQCDYQNCTRSWYVRCAAKAGIIKPWEQMLQELGNPSNQMLIPIFCKEHASEAKLKFIQQGENAIKASPSKSSAKKAPTTPKVPKVATSKAIKKPQKPPSRISHRIKQKPVQLITTLQAPNATKSRKPVKKQAVQPKKTLAIKEKEVKNNNQKQIPSAKVGVVNKVGVHKKEQQTKTAMQAAAQVNKAKPAVNFKKAPVAPVSQKKTPPAPVNQKKAPVVPATQKKEQVALRSGKTVQQDNSKQKQTTQPKSLLQQKPANGAPQSPQTLNNTGSNATATPTQSDFNKLWEENPQVAGQLLQQYMNQQNLGQQPMQPPAQPTIQSTVLQQQPMQKQVQPPKTVNQQKAAPQAKPALPQNNGKKGMQQQQQQQKVVPATKISEVKSVAPNAMPQMQQSNLPMINQQQQIQQQPMQQMQYMQQPAQMMQQGQPQQQYQQQQMLQPYPQQPNQVMMKPQQMYQYPSGQYQPINHQQRFPPQGMVYPPQQQQQQQQQQHGLQQPAMNQQQPKHK